MDRIGGFVFFGLLLCVLGLTQNSYACSSCGFSFNSDWASEGYANSGGFRLDARFDYIDQDQLRRGTRSISKDSFSLPYEDEEVQKRTITRATLLGLDYSPNKAWGLHLAVPLLDRTHSTFAPGDIETSHSGTSGLGDLNLVGRYQGFTELANLGVQFGIKIPSGTFTDNFNSGPEEGERIDRGLQNGTGTTNAILGVYYFGVLSPQLEYFAQVMADQPFRERDGFRPGTSVITSTGLGYQFNSLLRPQIQVNYKYESRETGEASDYDNSGGNVISLTPGVNITASKNWNLYVLVQVPVFQDLNGLQLAPHQILSVGGRYTF